MDLSTLPLKPRLGEPLWLAMLCTWCPRVGTGEKKPGACDRAGRRLLEACAWFLLASPFAELICTLLLE